MDTYDDPELAELMYREQILDHFKNPRNYGELDGANATHKESNPLCGDVITISLKIRDSKIKDIKFEGTGCAISQASASMLTEKAQGITLTDTKKLVKEDIFELLNIPLSPVRMKCALLSLDTLKNTVKIYEEYGKKNEKLRNKRFTR